MSDGAVFFRTMYLEHCEACRSVGIQVPTPEEWVALIGDHLRDGTMTVAFWAHATAVKRRSQT